MDWKRQIATTENLLDRIVALLLAIADLAERAAGAPDAHRRLALAIIRQAETVAGDFVGAPGDGCANRQGAPTCAIAAGDGPKDTPEDALALAMALRALAFMLRSTIGRRLSRLLAGEAGGSVGGLPRHLRDAAARRLPATMFPSGRRLDTS